MAPHQALQPRGVQHVQEVEQEYFKPDGGVTYMDNFLSQEVVGSALGV